MHDDVPRPGDPSPAGPPPHRAPGATTPPGDPSPATTTVPPSTTTTPPTTPTAPEDSAARSARRRITAEIWIVLGLSLGQSAVYAAVRLLDRYTRAEALAEQVATLNPTRNERAWLDLIYQVLSIGFALVPVALALYLLSGRGVSALRRIGLDAARPLRDLGVGTALAALIGIPGLGLYVVVRELGLSVSIHPAGLDPHWWAVPILIASALQNALLEEVVAVGYLVERLRDLRWSLPLVLVASALLRGAYHLYQGPGMAAGNVVMGLVFTGYYLRYRRVMPLVVAHTTLDVVAFVGYTLLPEDLLAGLGIT